MIIVLKTSSEWQTFLPPIYLNYDEFLLGLPKSFSINTTIGYHLRRMTDKLVPKGLRNQEVERACSRRPPIPYIPVKDKIGEQVNKVAGSQVFKLKLPDGTKVNHTQWDAGNNDTFIIHVMNVLSYCNRKGFFKAFMKRPSPPLQKQYRKPN